MQATAVIALLSALLPIAWGCKGCVNLDEYNFEKIVNRFKVTVAKFDVIYPYGEKHNAFAALAEELAHNNDLVFAQIGVKDYGDKENEALAKRYDVKDKDDIPGIRIFLGDVNKVVTFPKHGEYSLSNLRSFLRDNVDIYIGLPGCLKEFDKIAVGFAKGSNQQEKLKEAEELKQTLKDEEEISAAATYVKFMKRILEKGPSFVKSEVERLSKIVREGKVNDKKKQELTHHLNILHSFSVTKDEL